MNYIRDASVNGDIKFGERIKEIYIAETLKISRAPVREAMAELCTLGLLQSEPHKGITVAAPTSKRIMDVYTLNGVLEGYGVSQTIHLLESRDFRQIEALVEEMKELAYGSGDLHEISDLDFEFHDTLLSKVDNQALLDVIHRFYRSAEHLLLYYQWAQDDDPKVFYARHRELYEAAYTKDPMQVEQALREHYHKFGQYLAQFGSDVI
jgi:DNA-binding GntR family transcriptional regulator